MKLETMLGYDWGNPSSVMFAAEEHAPHVSEPNRPVFDPYCQTTSFNPDINFTTAHHHHFPVHHPINAVAVTHLTNFHDPPPYNVYPHAHAPPTSMLGLEPSGPTGLMVVLKREPMGDGRFSAEFNSRIGLNLGGRTYFASSENDFMNRVYLRSKILEPGSVSFPRCQAEGCIADLTSAKHYHRRHKVCEFHSKAATVVAAGLTQRFCQQCSRFHLLSEFDNGKRSCRRRLADHNRRRRKSNQSNHEHNVKSPHHHNNGKDSSSENLTKASPDDHSEPYSSSTTVVAISPPRISRDCFGNRSYTGGGAACSAPSTNSNFYYGFQS